MKTNSRKIIRFIGTIILILIVAGLLTYRKYQKKEQKQEKINEQIRNVIETNQKLNTQNKELLRVEEQRKNDSILQEQMDELEVKKKKSIELIQSLEKEIENKKEEN